MKAFKKLFTTLFLLCVAGTAMAQDVIVKTDQTTVMSKVLEITSTEIKYKKWNNQDGPTYSIDRSEVLSINYENGEVEFFAETPKSQENNYMPQPKYQYRGHMEDASFWGGHVKLDGRVLSNEEVRSLVDPESYDLYLKARREIAAATVLGWISGGALGAGLGYLFSEKPGSTTGLITCAIIMGITFPIGLSLEIIGGKEMKKVCDTYNNHNRPYSFNISPSMMRCDLPQSKGNCGLGMTVSMNF